MLKLILDFGVIGGLQVFSADVFNDIPKLERAFDLDSPRIDVPEQSFELILSPTKNLAGTDLERLAALFDLTPTEWQNAKIKATLEGVPDAGGQDFNAALFSGVIDTEQTLQKDFAELSLEFTALGYWSTEDPITWTGDYQSQTDDNYKSNLHALAQLFVGGTTAGSGFGYLDAADYPTASDMDSYDLFAPQDYRYYSKVKFDWTDEDINDCAKRICLLTNCFIGRFGGNTKLALKNPPTSIENYDFDLEKTSESYDTAEALTYDMTGVSVTKSRREEFCDFYIYMHSIPTEIINDEVCPVWSTGTIWQDEAGKEWKLVAIEEGFFPISGITYPWRLRFEHYPDALPAVGSVISGFLTHATSTLDYTYGYLEAAPDETILTAADLEAMCAAKYGEPETLKPVVTEIYEGAAPPDLYVGTWFYPTPDYPVLIVKEERDLSFIDLPWQPVKFTCIRGA